MENIENIKQKYKEILKQVTQIPTAEYTLVLKEYRNDIMNNLVKEASTQFIQKQETEETAAISIVYDHETEKFLVEPVQKKLSGQYQTHILTGLGSDIINSQIICNKSLYIAEEFEKYKETNLYKEEYNRIKGHLIAETEKVVNDKIKQKCIRVRNI